MGLNLFSNSCSSSSKCSPPIINHTVTAYVSPIVHVTKPVTPNPNPLNFKIIKMEQHCNAYILLAHYPNCTNFKGSKLIVLKGNFTEIPRELDPHFTSQNNILARFIPNEEGWKMARMIATTY